MGPDLHSFPGEETGNQKHKGFSAGQIFIYYNQLKSKKGENS